jgi:hypothetical protein
MSAYFIDPEGKIIHVGTSHIAKVISDPGRFGLTLYEIKQVYTRHGEPMGLEGNARSEIIIKLIENGWIRLRRYRDHWKCNVNVLDDTKRQHIRKWANLILDGNSGFQELDRNIDVIIDQPEKKPLKFTLQEILTWHR